MYKRQVRDVCKGAPASPTHVTLLPRVQELVLPKVVRAVEGLGADVTGVAAAATALRRAVNALKVVTKLAGSVKC